QRAPGNGSQGLEAALPAGDPGCAPEAPDLVRDAGDQLGERERVGGEVERGRATAAGPGDVLHGGATAGDADGVRADLGDREVVVEGPLHDGGLGGQQPGDDPPGRFGVVAGEL